MCQSANRRQIAAFVFLVALSSYISGKFYFALAFVRPLNPYIMNWIISFLSDRQQRVIVDGVTTEYMNINRGVPQGTVMGPIMISLMVNDIKPVHCSNKQVKFADDLTLMVKVNPCYDTSLIEIDNIKQLAIINRMFLHFAKIWGLVVHGNVTMHPPY